MKRVSQLLLILACLTSAAAVLFQIYQAFTISLFGALIGVAAIACLWLIYIFFNWLIKPSYLIRSVINFIMIPLSAATGLMGAIILPSLAAIGPYLVGSVTNQPFDHCEELPKIAELAAAQARGFDPNRKCCLDTMIGACLIVNDENRRTLPLEYAALDPQLFGAYIKAGADINLLTAIPTESSQVIEIALKRSWSTDQLRRAIQQASGDSRSIELLLARLKSDNSSQNEDLNQIELQSFRAKLKTFASSSNFTPIDTWNAELEKLIHYATQRHLPFGRTERAIMLCEIYRGFSQDASSQTSAINQLLSSGVDPDFLCPYKPLWWAVAEFGDSHHELLEKLLASGADLTLCQSNNVPLYREWVDTHRRNPCQNCAKVETLLKESFEEQLKRKPALFESQCSSGVDLEALRKEAADKNIPMYVNGTQIATK